MQNRISDESSSKKDSRTERGFVLIAVIWGLGLLSALVMLFVLNARTHTRINSNLLSQAYVEALADAGVQMAILDLVRTSRLLPEQRRFQHNGAPVRCVVDRETMLTISIQDEAGKVDLNAAGTPLLKALFTGVGVDEDLAARYADTIIDYRDRDDLKKLNGAEKKDYEEAGKPYGPKNFAFQAVDEIHQVLGLSDEHISTIMPLITVHTRRRGIDPNVASATIKAALMKEGTLLPSFSLQSNKRAFLVRVDAQHISGSHFIREAVISLRRSSKRGYQVMSWRMGEAGNSSFSGLNAPAC